MLKGYLQKAAILDDYPGYLEAGPFMEEDPIGINEGPSGSRNTQGSIEEDDDFIKVLYIERYTAVK